MLPMYMPVSKFRCVACAYKLYCILVYLAESMRKANLFLPNLNVVDLGVVIGRIVFWAVKNICDFQPS